MLCLPRHSYKSNRTTTVAENIYSERIEGVVFCERVIGRRKCGKERDS